MSTNVKLTKLAGELFITKAGEKVLVREKAKKIDFESDAYMILNKN
jgi:hypothetical protein